MQLPHVMTLLMFLAPRVPLFRSPIPLQFRNGDESSDKGDESPAFGKFGLSPAFREVVSLITGFFPGAKPADCTSVDLLPWFDDFGSAHCRDPRVFSSLFDKLAQVKWDIDKFQKAAD